MPKTMEQQQFTELADRTKLAERAREAAELVLVEGRTATEAAALVGVSRQAASRASHRVLDELRRAEGWPDDWPAITLIAPARLGRLLQYLRDSIAVEQGITKRNTTKPPELEAGDIERLINLISEGRASEKSPEPA